MGANRADEVGQVEAILVAQGSGYEGQELSVSYGHQSSSPVQAVQNSTINSTSNQPLCNQWLFNHLFDLSLLLGG
jgi:hypothetical protein